MNIKELLIEKERVAYINNDPTLAQFFDATLEYILTLEGEVNEKDGMQEKIDALEEKIAKARRELDE